MKRIYVSYITPKILSKNKINFQISLEINRNIDIDIMFKIWPTGKNVNKLY